MTCKWQVEIDPYATRVLAKHWPHVRRWDDVRTFPPDEGEWGVDLVAGGFPCQPVSIAGKRLLEADPRWLWPEFKRILCKIRPRFALLENVPGLLDSGLGLVLADLAEIGMDAQWSVLSAGSLGAPHLRARVFLMAYSDRKHRPAWMGIQRNDKPPLWPIDLESIRADWLEAVTRNARGADGLPGEMDRLVGIGNAVSPVQSEWIGRRIMETHA